MFLTAIILLLGLSFLSSILVLAAVIRSGQVDQMAENRRRAASRASDALTAEPGAVDADLCSEPDWAPAGRVASYPLSLHDRA